jgi:hypothetical protein
VYPAAIPLAIVATSLAFVGPLAIVGTFVGAYSISFLFYGIFSTILLIYDSTTVDYFLIGYIPFFLIGLELYYVLLSFSKPCIIKSFLLSSSIYYY